MKILVEVRHPAHLHHFHPLINRLGNNGHEVKIIAVKKDISLKLLDLFQLKYDVVGENKEGVFKKLFELAKQDYRVFKICKKFKPDIFIGRPSQTVTLNSRLLGIHSIIFAEDDFKAVFFNAIIALPFARFVLAPYVTNLGPFNNKKIGYSGYQKLAYLHPNIFKPDISKIKDYIDTKKPFFILRLAKLSAGHDIGASGITTELARKIIKILKPLGNIYITSERELEEAFEQYRIQLPTHNIHHALYFARMFIGDSQTMTTEAAILGTPAIRYSYFTGKLSYLEELEKKYELTYGFEIKEHAEFLNKISTLLQIPDLATVWKERREILLRDKIDVTAFMVWFIENYPKSLKVMKENPDYQLRFK